MEKKEQSVSAQQHPEEEIQRPTVKTKRIQIAKYELFDNKVKFFVAKGFAKKKWILIREIPVPEIEHIESNRNQLGLTVKGTVEWFYTKDENETFAALSEQLANQLSETAPQQQESPQPLLQVPQLEAEEQQTEETSQQKQETTLPQLEHPQETQQAPQEPPLQTEIPQLRQETKESEEQKKQLKPKITQVAKCEIFEGKIRLSATKGFFSKRLEIIQEIPIQEIEKFDSEGNTLTITWKGDTEKFTLKEKPDSFKTLVEQIDTTLEERRKNEERQIAEANEKNALRRAELLAVINKSMDIVDLTFDVLVSLQNKRINWQEVEDYCNKFGETMNFTGQTLPPLTLDYLRITSSAKAQFPREMASEAFAILKATYGYYANLKTEEDLKENTPNFEGAKDLVNAYYLLNDLMLGKFVGDKNFEKEVSELEVTLQRLAAENFKVDFESLKSIIIMEGDKQTLLEDCRVIFKEQIRLL